MLRPRVDAGRRARGRGARFVPTRCAVMLERELSARSALEQPLPCDDGSEPAKPSLFKKGSSVVFGVQVSDSSMLEFSVRRVGDQVGGYVQRKPESISESRHARRARCVVRRRVVARSRLMTNSRLRKVPCKTVTWNVKVSSR